jgi:hypothetical protein
MSYSWDKFLRPLSATDTNIQILDNNGIATHTINPYAILNVLINNNIIKISLRSGKVITIPFSTINESKLALPRIKQLIDVLNRKAPTFVDNELKNYVNSVTDIFFYQDNIPTGTGTNSIKEGTFWYDTEFGFLYVYINDSLSGYNWITAVGEVGPTGPLGPTGPAGPIGPTGASPFDELIAKNDINNPNNLVLFHYDSIIYNGANFNFVEVDAISGDATTYHIIVANNTNISVNSQVFSISSGVTSSTIISATISGTEILLIANGTGRFNYRGHSEVF